MRALACVLAAALLAGCAALPPQTPPPAAYLTVGDPDKAREVVLFGLGLIDVAYKFGGRNPQAGVDCSGMVSWIYEQVAGVRLPHNAAEIARITRPIERSRLKPGDLVFFNTLGRPFSHMGIYLGDDRFMHAPSNGGRVRTNRLSETYYASRFDAARTLFVD